MKRLTITKFPDDLEYKHISTSWEISTTIDFLNLIDKAYESVEYLNLFISSIEVPENLIYYARAKRHFDDDIDRGWLPIIKLYPSKIGRSIEEIPESGHEVPFIYVNEYQLQAKDYDKFEITCSKARLGFNQHLQTNWVITDLQDNILYNEFTKDNLLSLVVDKKYIKLDNKREIKIYVQHVGVNNISSKFGMIRAQVTHFNFYVESDLDFIPVKSDYRLVIKPKFKDDVVKLDKIVLLHNDLTLETFNNPSNTLLINKKHFVAGENYFIDIYPSTNDKIHSADRLRVVLEIAQSNTGFNLNVDYEFKNEFIEIKNTLNVVKKAYSEELTSNVIKLINSDNKVDTFRFKLDENIIEHVDLKTENELSDGDFFRCINSGNNRATYFTVKNDERLKVISDITVLGESLHNENFIIDRNLTDKRLMSMSLDSKREKIFGTIGNDGNGEFIMINNDEITTLPNRPDGVTEDSVLHYIGRGRLLSFGVSNDSVAYVYSIGTSTWTLVLDVPTEFKGLTLESVTRRDGNVLFINVGSEGTKDFLLYNVKTREFEIIESTITDYNTDIIVRLKTGFILFLPVDSVNGKSYIFK